MTGGAVAEFEGICLTPGTGVQESCQAGFTVEDVRPTGTGDTIMITSSNALLDNITGVIGVNARGNIVVKEEIRR
jgi:hypothetical protein